MKSFHARAAGLAFALALTAQSAHAQQPPVLNDPAQPRTAGGAGQQSPAPNAPAPAPAAVKVKYEGGVLGYQKQEGWLSFDDYNRRLVFKDKQQRELFSISYDALLAAWADTKSRTSTAGQVIAGTAPYGLGLPALLMRSKTRYLVLQYSDPDTNTQGVTSFKIGSKEVVNSVLHAVAGRADLTQRGDAYIRRKDAATRQTTP